MRIADEGGARVLVVGDRALTGAQLQLRAVLDIGEHDVLVSASAGEEAAEPETGEVHVYRVNELGIERFSAGAGVHSAVRVGRVTVLVSARPTAAGLSVQVFRDGKQVASVASYAEQPVLTAAVTLTEGAHGAFRAPFCSPRATRSRTGGFRSSWTRTAARTDSGWSPPTTPTSPRSGSPTRGTR